MRKFVAVALGFSVCLTLVAAKPGGGGGGGGASPPPNPQIAYRLLSGKTVKLVVANEDNTNQATLHSSARSFNFDLAPRGQDQIALSTGTGASSKLSLLTYTVTGSGTFAPAGIVDLAPAREGTRMDFSPDGRRIAFACCFDGTNETLAVYDLDDNTVTPWATGPFFWDFAWFREGNSIAYSTLLPTQLWELPGPGAEPILLYTGQGEINVDASRIHPGRLVVSYNDASGDARIGLFEEGAFIDEDIANSARAWQGTLSCYDTKLAFMGVQNTSGSQAFYIRDLTTNLNSLVSKNSNILLQFWPSCG